MSSKMAMTLDNAYLVFDALTALFCAMGLQFVYVFNCTFLKVLGALHNTARGLQETFKVPEAIR